VSNRSLVRRPALWVSLVVVAALGVGLTAAVRKVRDTAAHSSDL
jgi:hypothetical protein